MEYKFHVYVYDECVLKTNDYDEARRVLEEYVDKHRAEGKYIFNTQYWIWRNF